jgi:hypothetical protein
MEPEHANETPSHLVTLDAADGGLGDSASRLDDL